LELEAVADEPIVREKSERQDADSLHVMNGHLESAIEKARADLLPLLKARDALSAEAESKRLIKETQRKNASLREILSTAESSSRLDGEAALHAALVAELQTLLRIKNEFAGDHSSSFWASIPKLLEENVNYRPHRSNRHRHRTRRVHREEPVQSADIASSEEDVVADFHQSSGIPERSYEEDVVADSPGYFFSDSHSPGFVSLNYVPRPAPDEFPWPIEKVNWLPLHELPASGIPEVAPGEYDRKPTTSIKFFEVPDPSLWYTAYEPRPDPEPVPPEPKVPRVSYPFTQKSPRKLPWDYTEHRIVPTRPNKAVPSKALSYQKCERFMLEKAREPITEESQSIPAADPEFAVLQFWVSSALGFGHAISDLRRFSHGPRFQQVEREFKDLKFVFFPTAKPGTYGTVPLPTEIVVHRFVSNYRPKSFVICAASLGNQAVSCHPKTVPTESLTEMLKEDGYDTLWFLRDDIESILILDSSRVVPIYSCTLE
jgi:hypothetical protein